MKLFFYKDTGLLARVVRYNDTVVGIVPTETDYSDYRDVAGVKMPFHWTITWTDGQSTIELSKIQPNAAIEPSRFAKPTPQLHGPSNPKRPSVTSMALALLQAGRAPG